MEDKVTVYITTFNRLALLKRAIDSVKKQSYKNIEIIVADDGSNDGSVEYLKSLDADNFKCIFNLTGENKGACYGRNQAIIEASGTYITGLDDDDYFESWRIESFIKFWKQLKSNNIAGLFDSAIEMRHDGSFKSFETKLVTNKQLRNYNLIGNQIFTTKEKLLSIDGFDVNMPAWQDWDTWIRLSHKAGCFFNINSYSYRIDQSHDIERISIKKSKFIRLAYCSLIDKLEPITLSEKINITNCLYNYSQVDFRLIDISYLILGCRFKLIGRILFRVFK